MPQWRQLTSWLLLFHEQITDVACETNSEGELWISPTSKSELYVGDENGNVYVWKAASPQNCHQKCCFEGSGVPWTVVAAAGKMQCSVV